MKNNIVAGASSSKIQNKLGAGCSHYADHFVDVNIMVEFGSGRLLTFLIADHFPETGKMVEIQKYAEA